MNPYLEHPSLCEGFHSRCVVKIANLLQPMLDPRYVASVEERVFIEGLQQRIPDVWIQKFSDTTSPNVDLNANRQETISDAAVIVEVEYLEIHQKRIEILDSYNQMKLVTVIELLIPSNKRTGPGQQSYLRKQQEILEGDCHLVEIDLLRTGTRTLCVPEWKLDQLGDFDYVVCVNRWPQRTRFELYTRRLETPMPRIAIPLSPPDSDPSLDLQLVIEQVYEEARYEKRLRYDEPCVPALSPTHQQWALQLLTVLQ